MLHRSTVDSQTFELLQKLFSISIIGNHFALAGGTALALQIGHRTSIDLDVFNPGIFDVKELEIILSDTKDIHFQYRGNNSRMLFADINGIKCDFVHEPATLLEPFILSDAVKYFSLPDIGAMKLHTICGRGKKKDFFDIYCLLQLFSWEVMVQWFIDKYDESQLVFLWRSILYFDDANADPDIIGFNPFNTKWEQIKKYIKLTCN